jgi:hypothetical protein
LAGYRRRFLHGRDTSQPGQEFLEQFKPLPHEITLDDLRAGDISAWSSKILGQPSADKFAGSDHDDGNASRLSPDGVRDSGAGNNNDLGYAPDRPCGDFGRRLSGPDVVALYKDIAAFFPPQATQGAIERCLILG